MEHMHGQPGTQIRKGRAAATLPGAVVALPCCLLSECPACLGDSIGRACCRRRNSRYHDAAGPVDPTAPNARWHKMGPAPGERP